MDTTRMLELCRRDQWKVEDLDWSVRPRALSCADEIAVSNVVRDLCVGKDLQFELLGEFELKGFRDAVTVYKVGWRSPAAVAQEPASTVASGANGPAA